MKTTALIVMCLTLIACATNKNIDIQHNDNYSNELQSIRSSLDSLQMNVNKQSQITSDKLSNLKMESKTIYMSPPDSTGKQYTIKQHITNIQKEDKELTKEVATVSASVMQISNKVDSLSQQINELMQTKDSVVELSWWDLHKDKVYGVVLLLVFGYVFMSRFVQLTRRQ